MNLGFEVVPVRKTSSFTARDSAQCGTCGNAIHETGKPGDLAWSHEAGDYASADLDHIHVARPAKTSSLIVTAQEVGYYVVSRNGAIISGPYATRSDAAPKMIEQRGAAIEFKGPGDSAEWAATKAKPFPVGLNSVNGSRRTSEYNDKWCGSPESDDDEYDFGADHDRSARSDNPFWNDVWEQHSKDRTAANTMVDGKTPTSRHKYVEDTNWGDESSCTTCGRTKGDKVHTDHSRATSAKEGSMQDRYATGRRLASLRHFADGNEGIEEQVNIGEAPEGQVQDPNPLAGQDLERIPRNLAEAALWAQADVNSYDQAEQNAMNDEHLPWCATGCGLEAAPGDIYCSGCGSANDRSGWIEEQYPEDREHDQLDDPWNQQPSAGEY